ncbi:pseudouridine synthase [Multifurca ochricompacta]|uniref:tRNA pseudouridine synthase 1 n=1 Tax=Multifurca ochricompacta TaxID=376703 RepID=A0AAD4MA20_9AGAM|nr:pseudouridine synthase [Multifurca ochricompacta]
MTEGASTSSPSPTKRYCDEDLSPRSPKRVKVDPRPIIDVDVNPLGSSTDILQDKQKSQKRRDAAGYPKSRQGKVKDNKNVGRRRGSRPESTDTAMGHPGAVPKDASIKAARLPKRQSAILLGFCGTGCAGMQIQPDARTIEGVLFDTLVRVGAVSSDNADDPTKVGLGRAARTDAGVHAAGNLVSLKLITQIPDVPDLISAVNGLLPPEIRVWGIIRVQNSFNARTSCDSRKYTYFFPSYLLIPPKPGSGLYETFRRQTGPSSGGLPIASPSTDVAHPFWADSTPSSSKENDLQRKRRWRIEQEALQRLREVAKKFEGTRNFHNFTVGREFSDRSTQRHMKKIEIADPVVHGSTEWISVMFHGQSFMLHQRKMVSALVLCCRTGTPPQIIEELYGPRQVFIPKMPSLGLLLEHPIFESYNRKVGNVNEKLSPEDPEFRPPIDFDIHLEAIEEFKQAHIYDRMREIEDRRAVFDAWIHSTDAYSGDDLLYLNPKGVIPAAAVVKNSERRKNPFREIKRFDVTDFPTGSKIRGDEDEEDEGEQDVLTNKAALVEMEG